MLPHVVTEGRGSDACMKRLAGFVDAERGLELGLSEGALQNRLGVGACFSLELLVDARGSG